MSMDAAKPWIATVIGATAGMLAGGPFGAVAGAGLGHAWGRGWLWPGGSKSALQVELRLLFELLGHLAKADGRVSEREIAFAEGLMERFKLKVAARKEAIAAFDRGRQAGFQIDAAINQLGQSGLPGTDEAGQMVDILHRLAEADGPLAPAEKGALERIALRLGVSERRRKQPASQTTDITWTVSSARSELGVNSQADSELVRSAYKRLMSRYHPDKLAAQALSDQERSAAEDRLRRIRSAYEYLRNRP